MTMLEGLRFLWICWKFWRHYQTAHQAAGLYRVQRHGVTETTVFIARGGTLATRLGGQHSGTVIYVTRDPELQRIVDLILSRMKE